MGALIVVICAAILLYLPRKVEREAVALMSSKAETLAQLTAFTIHPAIFFQDRAALDEALSGAKRDRDVAYVIVFLNRDLKLTAFLYVVYGILAWRGLVEWRRSLQAERSPEHSAQSTE
jgi:hypothetical protein